MPHYRLERMLCGIVIEEELIAVFAHLTDVGSEYAVDGPDKCLHRIARTIEAVAVLFGQCASIAVRVSTCYDRLLVHDARKQTAWIVGDSEAIVKEYQAYITCICQHFVIVFWQTLHQSSVFRFHLIIPSLQ